MALELIRVLGNGPDSFWNDPDAQLLFDDVNLRHVVVSAADTTDQEWSNGGWETAVFPADEVGEPDIDTYIVRAAFSDDEVRGGCWNVVEGVNHQLAIDQYNELYGAPKPYDQDA